MAERSKAWVYALSLAEIADSNLSDVMDFCLSVIILCVQVQISATSRSLVQRIPTECSVSECDHEASTIRRPWSTRGCSAMGKKKYLNAVCGQTHLEYLNVKPRWTNNHKTVSS